MCTYRVVFPQAHRARTSSYSSYVPNPPKGCQSLGTRTFPILTSSEAEGADRFGMSTCQKRLYSVSPHNSRQLALLRAFPHVNSSSCVDEKSHFGFQIASQSGQSVSGSCMQNYTCKPPKMPNLIFCVTFGRLLTSVLDGS